MKLSLLRVKLISDAVQATFEAAVNTFLATAGERQFIGVQYQFDGANYTALIIYTE